MSSLLLSLREGVMMAFDEDGALVVHDEYRRLTVGQSSARSLAALSASGTCEDHLARQAFQAGGVDEVARFYYHLGQLVERGFVVRSSHLDGTPLATLIPTAASPRLPGPVFDPDGRFALSRFAFSRAVDGRTVLESPRSTARVVLHDWRAMALVHALARPSQAREVAERVPGLTPAAAEGTLALLCSAGMLDEHGGGSVAEADGPALRSWEFHDLLFHTRSRLGRTDLPFGATYSLGAAIDPPPAVKRMEGAETIELERPDLARLEREDVPFARVVERRCSLRDYGPEPITARQLGEFLYRVARVKHSQDVRVETPDGSVELELTSRPYPAGGGLYELEIYPVIRACGQIPPGLYHYDPLEHRLDRLAGREPEAEELLGDAARCAGVAGGGLQVLLIVSARFQRLRWKYSAMSYALVLKHVGVLQQTMYLTAAAMNLAPCALGGGNSDLFARALESDYYAETSVGEFLLGSTMDSAT